MQQHDDLFEENKHLEAEESTHRADTEPLKTKDDSPPPTSLLSEEDRNALPDLPPNAYGFEPGSADDYVMLPESVARIGIMPNNPHWIIELHDLPNLNKALGLHIVGDVIIGRGLDGENPPDLDMDAFDGLSAGISRQHAMLRPSGDSLFIIDLGSTNGTRVNAIPLNARSARVVHNNTTVTLGKLSFTIKMIDKLG